jgi:hypothetical protein
VVRVVVVVVVVVGDRAVVGLGGFDVLAAFADLWLIELQPEASKPMHTTAAANRRIRTPANDRGPTVIRAYRDSLICVGMGTRGSYDQVEMGLTTFEICSGRLCSGNSAHTVEG